tara:strand:- start:528 stop:815 length:288 start_codon:yes stop_codon:yes gene_type:complete
MKLIAITSIEDPRPSQHGGQYRYIHARDADGNRLEPGCLATNMHNYDQWEDVVECCEKLHSTGEYLAAPFRIKKKNGKKFINCDYVPHPETWEII